MFQTTKTLTSERVSHASHLTFLTAITTTYYGHHDFDL